MTAIAICSYMYGAQCAPAFFPIDNQTVAIAHPAPPLHLHNPRSFAAPVLRNRHAPQKHGAHISALWRTRRHPVQTRAVTGFAPRIGAGTERALPFLNHRL